MESSTTCLANGIYVPTAMLEQAALNFPDSDKGNGPVPQLRKGTQP